MTRQLAIGLALTVLAIMALLWGLDDSGSASGSAVAGRNGNSALPGGVASQAEPSLRSAISRLDTSSFDFRVHVVNAEEVPIGGAVVRLWEAMSSDAATLADSVTDSQGEALLRLPVEAVARATSLGVRHQDYAEASKRIPAQEPGASGAEVTVQLSVGWTVRGVVTKRSSGAPWPGAAVLCSPTDVVVAPGQADAPQAIPGCHLVDTDVHGRFTVPGLNPEKTYLLRAAAPGLVSEVVAIESPDSTASLELDVVYGAYVRLRGSDGSPPLTSQLLRGWGPTITVPHAAPLLNTAPEYALCGLPSELISTLDRDTRLYLFRSRRAGLPEELTAGLFVDLPGYVPSEQSIVLKPIGLGVPEYTLDLGAPATEFGPLAVTFEGAAGLGSQEFENPRSRPLARLYLDPVGRADTQRYHINLTSIPTETLVLDRVPTGEYRVHLEPDHRLARVQGRAADGFGSNTVLVTSGAVAEVTFDMNEVGGAVVSLDDDGLEYRGALRLVVQQDADSGGHGIERPYPSAPYVLDLLPPGRYRAATTGRPQVMDGGTWFEVVAGRTAAVSLSARP